MQDQSNKLIIFFIVFFIIVAGISTATIMYLGSQSEPKAVATKKPGVITTSSNKGTSQKSAFANTSGIAGDVNDDSSVTAADVDMIKGQLGCSEGQDCWTRVIGKTLSGDNPIYVMDMDYSKDGSINEADIPQIAEVPLGN